MSVGKKLAKWRTLLGLTERQAALRVGVSQPTYRAVEHGEVKRIGLEIAMRFVDACDGAVSIQDFLAATRRRRAA